MYSNSRHTQAVSSGHTQVQALDMLKLQATKNQGILMLWGSGLPKLRVFSSLGHIQVQGELKLRGMYSSSGGILKLRGNTQAESILKLRMYSS